MTLSLQSQRFRLVIIGAMLGALQVHLVYLAMVHTSLSIYAYFMTVFVWLLAGAIATMFSLVAYTRSWSWVAVAGYVGSHSLVIRYPYDRMALGVLLVIAAINGAYATIILLEQSHKLQNISRVLLYEQLGFVLGWITATVLLFFLPAAIVGLVVVLFLLQLLLSRQVR